MDAFEDPRHVGNSEKYHTGELCIVNGCEHPAGTVWGPPWCFECNVIRIKRITKQMEEIEAGFQAKGGA